MQEESSDSIPDNVSCMANGRWAEEEKGHGVFKRQRLRSLISARYCIVCQHDPTKIW